MQRGNKADELLETWQLFRRVTVPISAVSIYSRRK